MNAKEFLLRVAGQTYIVNQIDEDIAEAMEDAYGLSGVSIGERVQTFKDPTWAIPAAVEEIERLKRKRATEVAKLLQIKREVKETIRLVENKKYAKVLELRYCKCMRLCQIARESGKKEGYIRRLHGEALECFRKKTGMK